MHFDGSKYYAWLLSLAACLALVVSLSGCAEDMAGDNAGCSEDADCGDEAYCLNAQCATACTHDEHCSADTYCELYQRHGDADPVQACLDEHTADNGGVVCESDQECIEFLNDDNAHCGLHQRCVLTPEATDPGEEANQTSYENDASNNDENATENGAGGEYPEDQRFVVIVEQLDADGLPVVLGEDNSDSGRIGRNEGDNGRNGDDDLGDAERPVMPVHLGAIVIRDIEHSVVGFGQTLAVESPTDSSPADGLVEAPVVLNEQGSCLKEPHDAPYTSLGGPGGRAFIELVDGYHDPLKLYDQWRLQILANGPECPIGPVDETVDESDLNEYIGKYRVFVCETDNNDLLPEADECDDTFAGPFSNFTDLEVTFDE